MIVDHLENAALYAPLSPRFAAAFAWLQTVRFEDLVAGRNPVDGTLYAMRNEYVTRPQSELPWEAHRGHADIQYMVEGEERVGFSPLSRMTITHEYNAAQDYALYSGSGDLFLLRAGQFAVFYPGDAHAPGIQVGDTGAPVKKIVVKVPLF